MSDRSELYIGLVVVALVGLSYWKGSTKDFQIKPAADPAPVQAVAEATPTQESHVAQMRKVRAMAKKAVQAGIGNLPPREEPKK